MQLKSSSIDIVESLLTISCVWRNIIWNYQVSALIVNKIRYVNAVQCVWEFNGINLQKN